jgi:hypothetical protein
MRTRNLLGLALTTLERAKRELPAPCPDVHGPDLDREDRRKYELALDIEEVIELLSLDETD